MAAEHELHSGEESPNDELGIRVVSAEQMEPASTIADIPDSGAAALEVKSADAGAADGWPGDERRWRETLVSFVDDPRGCVQAATELIEDDVSRFAGFLRKQRESLLNSGASENDVDTEQMRQIVYTYRDISRHLAASAQVCQLIFARHRGSGYAEGTGSEAGTAVEPIRG